MAPLPFSERKGRKRRDSYYATDINVTTKSSIAGEKGRWNSKPSTVIKEVRGGHYERMKAYTFQKVYTWEEKSRERGILFETIIKGNRRVIGASHITKKRKNFGEKTAEYNV